MSASFPKRWEALYYRQKKSWMPSNFALSIYPNDALPFAMMVQLEHWTDVRPSQLRVRFRHKADVTRVTDLCLLWGVKQTSAPVLRMSVPDPKRTSQSHSCDLGFLSTTKCQRADPWRLASGRMSAGGIDHAITSGTVRSGVGAHPGSIEGGVWRLGATWLRVCAVAIALGVPRDHGQKPQRSKRRAAMRLGAISTGPASKS